MNAVLNEVANSPLLPENSCSSFCYCVKINNTMILLPLTIKKKKKKLNSELYANKTPKPDLVDCIWMFTLFFERRRLVCD